MKGMKVLWLGLAFLACLVSVSIADVRTIPLGGQATELSLVEQDGTSLHYRARIGEIVAMDVATPSGNFTKLLIPGFHSSKTEGAPELPMMNRLIEIPFGGRARVSVLSVTDREIALSDYGITSPVFPAQPSMPKNADPAAWPFVMDETAYRQARVAQDLVRVTSHGRMRAAEIGRVELSPVEYFPGAGRILVHDTVDFLVEFDGADLDSGDAIKAATNSPFFAPVYDQLEGYRGIHQNYPDRVRDVVTYVIVVPPQFESTMSDFVAWKTRRGFRVVTGVTGTPEVGSTKESIKAWILGLYQNGTPQEPAPSFVLFVGDVEQMPTWTINGDATDRPYCDLEGDQVPDIYYGRFSATNVTQLQAILAKTLYYDKFQIADPSYLREVVMIAGMDGNYGQVWANGQINYGTSTYFNEAHGILSHTYLYPQSGSQEAAIIANLSSGCAFANYTAHGSETSWSDPTLTQANVNSLTNANKYFLAVGNCCLTSTYDYPECLAETMLRAPNKAAIGYIGGSNSTYWDEDYYFGVGYRSQIVEHPVFDPAHMGAYDGLFHDHGEAMDQWYVTNDAIIFCGNLAVTESGSGRIAYYWNIYNLMGDPSVSTYLGVPGNNTVTHPQTIFTTWTSIQVTAAPGSYVGLTKNGQVIGAGTVAANGTLTLPIWAQPLTPGTAHLCVMAQNKRPYETDLNVIVPATVTLDPSVIDANVTTPVVVGVFEYDGVTPKPGIEVWADGLGYESAHGFTDLTGHCTLTITYPYGPSLDIVGKDPNEAWELFREPLAVRAAMLNHPDLTVTTDIGLADTLALNLPAVLHATVSEPGHTLFAFQDGVLLGSTSGLDLPVTAGVLEDVQGIIAVSGYNTYSETFPVIEAYGTLSGHVSAAGGNASGAVVKGYDGNGDLAFQATANAQGNYAVADEILCASYTIMVDYFGYLHWEQPFFVNYGANVLAIDLEAAPAGILSGFVLENETDEPLEATVKIFRSDDNSLYAQTTTNPADGSFTTTPLPYFTYKVTVKAWHHIPETVNVAVDQPEIARDFWLDPTLGDLLVINDAGKAGDVPAKVDPKSGAVIEPGYATEDGKALADILASLDELGYTSTVETMAGTDPATWPSYDMLLVTSGNNTTSLNDAGFRQDLTTFVQSGGHVLIEGGEVGYDHQGDAAFAANVLHIADWTHDQSGNVTVVDAAHRVMSYPNAIPSPITMSYANYGDQDALTATADAARIGAWTTYPTDASVIAYDPNPAPEGGQIVFFGFNYSAMDANVRPLLLQNAITWLTTPEEGNCSVSGTVTLAGQADHSGVLVQAIPNGGSATTNAAGEYSLPGLFAGTYTIRASKDGWSTDAEQVTLADGQQLAGVNFVLSQIYTHQFCRQPNLSIPDNNPTGVTDNMPVLIGGATVSGLEVYVRITHPYIGDLSVRVVSPRGTTVILHNRTGGSADNIVGWYPTQLVPNQSLDAFIGEPTDGIWKLTVIDHASSDVGVLNEWCLKFYHGATVDVADGETPKTLALAGATPNPLRTASAIRFDMPSRDGVDLAIYDVAGRLVTTLVAGTQEAGRHEVVWNGRNSAGQAVPNGLYIARLTVGGRRMTQKVIVLK